MYTFTVYRTSPATSWPSLRAVNTNGEEIPLEKEQNGMYALRIQVMRVAVDTIFIEPLHSHTLIQEGF